jgi:hypothetical protein
MRAEEHMVDMPELMAGYEESTVRKAKKSPRLKSENGVVEWITRRRKCLSGAAVMLAILGCTTLLGDKLTLEEEDREQVEGYLRKRHINRNAASAYAGVFSAHGYETKEQVAALSKAQLAGMGVAPGHVQLLAANNRNEALRIKVANYPKWHHDQGHSWGAKAHHMLDGCYITAHVNEHKLFVKSQIYLIGNGCHRLQRSCNGTLLWDGTRYRIDDIDKKGYGFDMIASFVTCPAMGCAVSHGKPTPGGTHSKNIVRKCAAAPGGNSDMGNCSSDADCGSKCAAKDGCIGYIDMSTRGWGYQLKNYLGPSCVESRAGFVLVQYLTKLAVLVPTMLQTAPPKAPMSQPKYTTTPQPTSPPTPPPMPPPIPSTAPPTPTPTPTSLSTALPTLPPTVKATAKETVKATAKEAAKEASKAGPSAEQSPKDAKRIGAPLPFGNKDSSLDCSMWACRNLATRKSTPPRVFIYDDVYPDLLSTLLQCDVDATGLAKTQRLGWDTGDGCTWPRYTCYSDPWWRSARGGLGADMFVYLSLQRSPLRTADPALAASFYIPTFQDYSLWLFNGAKCPSAGTTHKERYAAIGKRVMESNAWKCCSEQHFLFGAAEFASTSYKDGGSVFGEDPKFNAAGGDSAAGEESFFSLPLAMLNQEGWGKDVGFGHRLGVPYVGVEEFVGPETLKYVEEELEVQHTFMLEGAVEHRRDTLLFFKGSRNFGGARAQLEPLKNLLASEKVDIKAGVLGSMISYTDTDPKAKSAKYDYKEYFLKTRFCIMISGHSCTTRRLYDSIAAGCIPLFVDCAGAGDLVLSNRVDYSSFALFYPLPDVHANPAAFVECVRSIPPATVRKLQQGLAKAREVLVFAWKKHPGGTEYGDGIPKIATASDFTFGKLGENLLQDMADQCHISPSTPQCQRKGLSPIWQAMPALPKCKSHS